MNRLLSRSLITVLALFVLFCVPSIASADGVPWVLTGVTFDDGGTASGSFVYDALTNTYSAINVTTTAGITFAGATYTSLSNVAGSSNTGFLFGPNSGDLTGASFLMWLFDAPLTNSGGIVQVSLPPPTDSIEALCANSDCSTFSSRSVTGGEVVGTAVATPEPATFSLVGMGLVALLAGAAIRKVLLA
jgi:PEP-CTERM motif